MSKHQDLLFEVTDGVATITLARPDKRNAFSIDMIDGWVEALEEIKRSDAIKTAILTAKGECFCAGGDIRELQKGYQTAMEGKNLLWEGIHRVPCTLMTIDKPIFAAINGPAFGAGMDMALMCDMRIASEKATFCQAYVNVGLMPGDGGTFLLPRLVGIAKACELIFTGKVISANEAKELGIVNEVASPEELLAITYEKAHRLAKGPILAIRAAKRAIYQNLAMELRFHLDYVSSQMGILLQTEDHKEAVNAFIERRDPIFKGK